MTPVYGMPLPPARSQVPGTPLLPRYRYATRYQGLGEQALVHLYLYQHTGAS